MITSCSSEDVEDVQEEVELGAIVERPEIGTTNVEDPIGATVDETESVRSDEVVDNTASLERLLNLIRQTAARTPGRRCG